MYYLWPSWTKVGSYPQQSLFVLAVLHFGRRQVDDGSLHTVPLAAVQVDVRPAHHHVALHPAAGVRLQEVKVALLWHDWAATGQNEQTQHNTRTPDVRQDESTLLAAERNYDIEAASTQWVW